VNRHLEDVEVGTMIPPITKVPSAVGLFRFSAITWNPHLIHYNRDVAMSEGHENIVVHSHLHGSYLLQVLMAWAGPRARITKFGWQNKRAVLVGEQVTCSGTVVDISDAGTVECKVEEHNQAGELCANGWATVLLPRRSS
jgi:hydroxyacyl-ACP dehydratase HTD2-like protein with hotdog domain